MLQYRWMFKCALLGFIILLCGVPKIEAHSLGQSYIFMRIYDHSVQGSFQITIDDINRALHLTDSPDAITTDNLSQNIPMIEEYYRSRVTFFVDGKPCEIRFNNFEIFKIKIAEFVTLDFVILDDLSEAPTSLDIDYSVLFDEDPDHRGLLVIEHYWKDQKWDNESIVSLVFSPHETRQTLDLSSASIWRGFIGVIKMGVIHIWLGIDHLLFLMALILPAVMHRRENRWEPVATFKPALIYVIKIVTLFTIAHSITLSVAALGIVELPSRLVESIIAISIIAAALDIIFPIFKEKIWMVVFGFGLFHGFGFASVLSHLGILGEYMAISLFGFNLGVELGQVAVIAVIFPALYLVRQFSFYRPLFLKSGAAAMILIATIWFVERAFELNLPLTSLIK